ncbi:MAG: hypothetical protein MK108_09650 [Mariniblastus sp.]|nr:hypothetical protein [Mariniblastus sp.]
MRTVYGLALLLLICTAWMILAGTQVIRNVGDMARFGAILFQILAPLQLAIILFLSAIQSASSIAVEKDRQTLILLLMSRLTNSELVLGKLFSSLLNNGVMLMTSIPILMLIVLFGGTSFDQVAWTVAVTFSTALTAGSIGATVALWREKTFQTLALVALAIVFWIGLAAGIGLVKQPILGLDPEWVSSAMSPISAILAASSPSVASNWSSEVVPYLLFATALTISLCSLSVFRVRKWNPNREVRPGQQEEYSGDVDLFTGQVKLDEEGNPVAQTGTSHHVDDRSRKVNQKSRRVWDNPILWREMCTWAYGRKILFIRIAYWAMAAMVFVALYSLMGEATRATADASVSIPIIARPFAPFLLVSLVMVNALAVTSITNERDGRALDLLRVTDISPKEFLFGKVFGVLYVAIDIVLIPVAMCLYLAFNGAITVENLLYLLLAVLILNVFVTVLGIHCGMSYGGSRQAISVSLGTVFFLFLGIVTCMVMMVSFTGNVEAQLTPFLACIVGGAIGLYVALGWNTPSPALVLASAVLPLAMFYSITSLLLENYLSVILVVAFTYGFTTTAMVMPRLSEFLVSTGRSKISENE